MSFSSAFFGNPAQSLTLSQVLLRYTRRHASDFGGGSRQLTGSADGDEQTQEESQSVLQIKPPQQPIAF